MIYFLGILLWISPASVDIPAHRRIRAGLGLLLALVVLEEFHLAQALFGFCARLVRAAEIFAFLLRDHFVAFFYFFDHVLPSCADFPRPLSRVNTMAAVELLASGFLRYVRNRQGGEIDAQDKAERWPDRARYGRYRRLGPRRSCDARRARLSCFCRRAQRRTHQGAAATCRRAQTAACGDRTGCLRRCVGRSCRDPNRENRSYGGSLGQ